MVNYHDFEVTANLCQVRQLLVCGNQLTMPLGILLANLSFSLFGQLLFDMITPYLSTATVTAGALFPSPSRCRQEHRPRFFPRRTPPHLPRLPPPGGPGGFGQLLGTDEFGQRGGLFGEHLGARTPSLGA